MMESMKIGKQMVTLLVIYAFLFQHVHASIISGTNGTDATEDRAFKSDEIETGRTFGAIKKFQTALLPIMYKLGVMSAVIMMTLFLAFKGVFIGTLILVLNLTFFAIKFGSFLKQDHFISHSHGGGWSQPIQHGHGWGHKDVHLHIHNGHGKPDFTIPYSTLSGNSGGWDTQTGHSNIEPTWNPTGTNYVHSGRGFSGDESNELTSFASAVLKDRSSTDKGMQNNGLVPKVNEKRNDRPPTIVMAQTKQIVTPYNYLNKQNRRK